MLTNKNLLSLCIVVAFAALAIGSQANKMSAYSFHSVGTVEDIKDKRNYIVLNDGTQIFGKDVNWKSGLLLKKEVILDKEKYKTSEVMGLRMGNYYYGRWHNDFIKRVVHGPKLNVYEQIVNTTSNDGKGHMTSHSTTNYFLQKGEMGEMERMTKFEDLQQAVADCPMAASMLDMKAGKLRKTIRRNRDYLHDVLAIYNSGCKQVR
jgi:hypothetical protein